MENISSNSSEKKVTSEEQAVEKQLKELDHKIKKLKIRILSLEEDQDVEIFEKMSAELATLKDKKRQLNPSDTAASDIDNIQLDLDSQKEVSIVEARENFTTLLDLNKELMRIRKGIRVSSEREKSNLLEKEKELLAQISEQKKKYSSILSPKSLEQEDVVESYMEVFNSFSNKAKAAILATFIGLSSVTVASLNHNKGYENISNSTQEQVVDFERELLAEMKKDFIEQYKDEYYKQTKERYTGDYDMYEEYMSKNSKKVLRAIDKGISHKTSKERGKNLVQFIKEQYAPYEDKDNTKLDKIFFQSLLYAMREQMEDEYATYDR